MRVLLIVTKADLSGAPIHVRDLAIELDRRGYEVMVIAGSDGFILSELRNKGIAVSILPSMKSNLNLINDIKSIYGMRRVFKSFRPDLVHAHSSKAGMLARISTYVFQKKTPVVFTVHGWGFGKNRPRVSSFFVFITEYLCRFITDFYVFVSEHDRVNGMKYLGIKSERSTLIWNGVRAPAVSKIKEGTRSADIIMVARNHYPKDYRTLILALKLIDFDRVVFVGEGTDSKDLVEFAEKVLGKSINKIEFLGLSNDVGSLLSSSKIFVLSSFFEGFPISIVEAMSHGVPVVASNVGGISEMIKDRHTGCLFEAGDYKCLGRLLKDLLEDEQMCAKLGINGKNFYHHNLEFESSFSKLEAVYNNLCKNAPR